jgi:hypothetical protein
MCHQLLLQGRHWQSLLLLLLDRAALQQRLLLWQRWRQVPASCRRLRQPCQQLSILLMVHVQLLPSGASSSSSAAQRHASTLITCCTRAICSSSSSSSRHLPRTYLLTLLTTSVIFAAAAAATTPCHIVTLSPAAAAVRAQACPAAAARDPPAPWSLTSSPAAPAASSSLTRSLTTSHAAAAAAAFLALAGFQGHLRQGFGCCNALGCRAPRAKAWEALLKGGRGHVVVRDALGLGLGLLVHSAADSSHQSSLNPGWGVNLSHVREQNALSLVLQRAEASKHQLTAPLQEGLQASLDPCFEHQL